jgi:2,4-dienoyl-CoA reductase-like NADH-dependent reductase (Old Yellow Enzyme family)
VTIGTPLRLPNGVTLRNRIAKAALSECLADRRGNPTPELERLYRMWGDGGAGLLVTGNIMVDRAHVNEPFNVVIDRASDRVRLERWVQTGREGGAHVLAQLNHPGRQAQRWTSLGPVAPSAVRVKLLPGAFSTPRVLSDAEIEMLIERYAQAAVIASETGFSGVQLQAAHGYLISQFLSPRTNLRSDRWGGDLDGRTRFLRRIVGAVRAGTPDDFVVAVKLNAADFLRGGFSGAESVRVAQLLERDGVDLIELSGGTYEAPAMLAQARASTREREAFFLSYAAEVRAASRVPLMLTGGFRTLAGMADALASTDVDVIGMGRPFVFTPDLPLHLLADRPMPAVPGAPRLGIRLDFALDDYWHLQHLHRTAHDRGPKRRNGLLATVAGNVALLARWQTARRAYGADAPGRSTL